MKCMGPAEIALSSLAEIIEIKYGELLNESGK
jgi:xanthine/CO dehydrogenase XdhC/CoxF family maturation factor